MWEWHSMRSDTQCQWQTMENNIQCKMTHNDDWLMYNEKWHIMGMTYNRNDIQWKWHTMGNDIQWEMI